MVFVDPKTSPLIKGKIRTDSEETSQTTNTFSSRPTFPTKQEFDYEPQEK